MQKEAMQAIIDEKNKILHERDLHPEIYQEKQKSMDAAQKKISHKDPKKKSNKKKGKGKKKKGKKVAGEKKHENKKEHEEKKK